MAEIKINGKKIEIPVHYTLLQALEEAGEEVPRFCFHEKLSIAGNCRMCLVEVKSAGSKPIASCAMNVSDLRAGPDGESPEIFTNTPMVRKAREGIIEFLLLNHPLDCPICDQGGECDLQDQAMAFGTSSSRQLEHKRAVEEIYLGPLVATAMTRCIHCTRCVRFMTEIAGVPELGMIGRGEDARISTWSGLPLSSELQGNIIDLCPVGALTSRPHSFSARSWELSAVETIDVMDAVGSAIQVESRGCEVIRILPRVNEKINEEWISDKTRFICDGLGVQRIDRPYIRKDGCLRPASWLEALDAVRHAVMKADSEKIGAIAGDLATVEEIYALKILLDSLGCKNMDCRQDGAYLDPLYGRASYVFNPTIEGIETADALLMIGVNPRWEAPLLNARIRKRSLKGNFPVGVIGSEEDFLYDCKSLGKNTSALKDCVEGKGEFFKAVEKAQRPIIMVGQSALRGKGGKAVLAHAAKLALSLGAIRKDWNGLGVLHNAAARVGGLDVGFVPGEKGRSVDKMFDFCTILFLLGADEIDMSRTKSAFIVYIGSHGDAGAQGADVVLPGVAYTEKSGTYVNTEGRVQQTMVAVSPPGESREDWLVVRELSDALDKKLSFKTLEELRNSLYVKNPHLAEIGRIIAPDYSALYELAKFDKKLESDFLSCDVKDFYLTNPIARASATMASCSALALSRKNLSGLG